MSDTLMFVLVLGFTFLCRWWPRLVCPRISSSDSYYHLTCAANIRAHGFRVPALHPRLVMPGDYLYPPGYHYLLAVFPTRIRYALERISGAVFDTLLVALFLSVTITVLRPQGWDSISLLLLGIGFSLSPALVGVSTGPRAYEGTSRPMAELLLAAAMTVLWMHARSENWLLVVVAVGLCGLLLISSKFGAQALLSFSVVMALARGDVLFLTLPLLAFVAAVALSRGHYFVVMRDHIEYLVMYATRLVHSHPATAKRRRAVLPRNLKQFIRALLFDNVYFIVLAKFSVTLIVAGVLIWKSAWTGATGVDSFLVAWLAAALVVFLVVSMRSFVFLGEADRYLEYALLPAFVLFGFLLPQSVRTPVLVAVVAGHAVLYVLHLMVFIRSYRLHQSPDWFECLEFLKQRPRTVLLSVKGLEPWDLIELTHHDLCYSMNFTSLITPPSDGSPALYNRFPLNSSRFDYFAAQHGARLIVTSKSTVEKATQEQCSYDFSAMQCLFENEGFVVYEMAPECFKAGTVRDDELSLRRAG